MTPFLSRRPVYVSIILAINNAPHNDTVFMMLLLLTLFSLIKKITPFLFNLIYHSTCIPQIVTYVN